MRRCYRSVQIAPVMQEHYNPSVDSHVSSVKQIDESFKRKSDEISEATGIETRLAQVDPKDLQAGATNEGLEATNRVRHARGLPEVSFD
jgi:hypothetical protein